LASIMSGIRFLPIVIHTYRLSFRLISYSFNRRGIKEHSL
jgi:hypothetical protein